MCLTIHNTNGPHCLLVTLEPGQLSIHWAHGLALTDSAGWLRCCEWRRRSRTVPFDSVDFDGRLLPMLAWTTGRLMAQSARIPCLATCSKILHFQRLPTVPSSPSVTTAAARVHITQPYLRHSASLPFRLHSLTCRQSAHCLVQSANRTCHYTLRIKFLQKRHQKHMQLSSFFLYLSV